MKITCSKLRRLFGKCKLQGAGDDAVDFSENEQQESGEFLMYILSIFDSQNLAVRINTTYATNSTAEIVPKSRMTKTSELIDDRASVVVKISSFILKDKEDLDNKINIFLKEKEDSGELQFR